MGLWPASAMDQPVARVITQWMGLVALALLEPKWLRMRTRSTTTMITLISHNQHPQTYNGLRFSTVPGDICEKSRREELFKTKNEKHFSNSSFLLVSTRFCFLLLFLPFSFSAVTLKQINIHKLTTAMVAFSSAIFQSQRVLVSLHLSAWLISHASWLIEPQHASISKI